MTFDHMPLREGLRYKDLTIINGFVSSNIYDKCNDFDFDSFPYLYRDIYQATYISAYSAC